MVAAAVAGGGAFTILSDDLTRYGAYELVMSSDAETPLPPSRGTAVIDAGAAG